MKWTTPEIFYAQTNLIVPSFSVAISATPHVQSGVDLIKIKIRYLTLITNWGFWKKIHVWYNPEKLNSSQFTYFADSKWAWSFADKILCLATGSQWYEASLWLFNYSYFVFEEWLINNIIPPVPIGYEIVIASKGWL